MSLAIAAYRQAGDTIEDVDVDDNADIAVTKLSTRTLCQSIPAASLQKSGASVANALQGVYGGALLPDANTGNLYGTLPLPDEWVSGGNITMRIWWLSSATAGNAKFTGNLKSATINGTTALEETGTVTTAAQGVANTLNSSTIAFAAADFTVGDIIGFNVSRDPTDAADTIAADVKVLAIDFEFTGRG